MSCIYRMSHLKRAILLEKMAGVPSTFTQKNKDRKNIDPDRFFRKLQILIKLGIITKNCLIYILPKSEEFL